MNKINSEIKIGIVAILSVVVLVWGLNFLKGTSIFSNNVFYYSIYSDVAGMDVSAPVRINGFNIGKVSDVYFHPNNSGKLVVKFELNNDFKIPINSIATIYNTDLMGTKAIKLVLGNSLVYASKGDTLYSYSEGDLKDEVNKQVLPLKNKAEDLISSIDSVMTVITTVLDKDARSSLTNSLYSLNRTFSTMELAMLKIDSMIYYNDNRVSNILSNIESISSNIHNNNELISSILKNFESISDSLSKSEIKSTFKNVNNSLDNFNKIMSKIDNGEGTIGLLINDKKLYTNLSNASDQLNQLIIDIKKRPRRYVNFSLIGGNKTSFEFNKLKKDTTK